MRRCVVHTGVKAVGVCSSCERSFCAACLDEYQGQRYCRINEDCRKTAARHQLSGGSQPGHDTRVPDCEEEVCGENALVNSRLRAGELRSQVAGVTSRTYAAGAFVFATLSLLVVTRMFMPSELTVHSPAIQQPPDFLIGMIVGDLKDSTESTPTLRQWTIATANEYIARYVRTHFFPILRSKGFNPEYVGILESTYNPRPLSLTVRFTEWPSAKMFADAEVTPDVLMGRSSPVPSPLASLRTPTTGTLVKCSVQLKDAAGEVVLNKLITGDNSDVVYRRDYLGNALANLERGFIDLAHQLRSLTLERTGAR